MQRWRRPPAELQTSLRPPSVRAAFFVATPAFPVVTATAVFICVLGWGAGRADDVQPHTERPVLTVVELFTSQGCSSCPPADVLMGDLARRDDVLPLSLHVDYWDYLGWKDPFASPAHSARQREYARALGLKYIYTPQIVVQGRAQVAGNERETVLQTIAAQERTKQPLVTVSQAGAQLAVSVDGVGGARLADVWLVLYDRTRSTRIDRGENSGRALVNFNVVRSFRRIAQWQGEPVRIVVSPDTEDWISRGCAVVLQVEATGPILDAVPCTPVSG
jgi:hypothetical protein